MLSTSFLNKVLKPEVVVELECEGGRRIKFFLKVDQFEDLRREVAYMLRNMQQLEVQFRKSFF